MANIIDTFTRADNATSLGVAESGQTWVYALANLGISTNTAYRSAASWGIAVIDTGFANIDASVTIAAAGGSSRSGIVFRGQANGFADQWSFRRNTTGLSLLQRRIAGVATDFTTGQLAATTGDVLRVVTDGSSIKCYVNGVLAQSVIDSTYALNTQHGMEIENAGTALDGLTIGKNQDVSAALGVTAAASDSFNRADSTTLGTVEDGGQAWSEPVGANVSIISSQVGSAGVANNLGVADFGSADGIVKVTYAAGLPAARGGITFRLVDGSNFWRFQNSGSGTAQVLRTVGGSNTYTNTTATTIANGDTLRVVMRGNDLWFYVNSVCALAITDAVHNAGTKHGVQVTETAVAIDDFSFTSFAGAAITSTLVNSKNVAGGRGRDVSDTFTRADNATAIGIADSGQLWTTRFGAAMGVLSGKAYTTTTNAGATVNLGATDFDVQCTFDTGPGGLMLNSKGVSDRALFFRRNSALNGGFIVDWWDGVNSTTLFTSATFSWPVTLRATGVGDLLTFYINATQVFQTTFGFQNDGTNYGVIMQNANTGRADNFTATALNGQLWTAGVSADAAVVPYFHIVPADRTYRIQAESRVEAIPL